LDPPEAALADKPKRIDHLVVREDHADVVRLASKATGQPRERRLPPCAKKIVLGVNP
jgi:hypothetical protein